MLEIYDVPVLQAFNLDLPELLPFGFEALPYTIGFLSLTHCADGFNFLLCEGMIVREPHSLI
jgi:hypothetical protein